MTTISASLARRSLLRTALQLDAAVTGVNGAAYLALAGPLEELLGLDAALLRGTGAFLLVFAALVGVAAARPVPRPGAVGAIVAANVAWAVASVIVAAAGWDSPATAGTAWILMQATVVAGFAALQAAGLARR
jgi:hypothetical protein